MKTYSWLGSKKAAKNGLLDSRRLLDSLVDAYGNERGNIWSTRRAGACPVGWTFFGPVVTMGGTEDSEALARLRIELMATSWDGAYELVQLGIASHSAPLPPTATPREVEARRFRDLRAVEVAFRMSNPLRILSGSWLAEAIGIAPHTGPLDVDAALATANRAADALAAWDAASTTSEADAAWDALRHAGGGK